MGRDLERLQTLMREPVVGSALIETDGGAFIQQFVSRDGEVAIPRGQQPLPLFETPTIDHSADRPRLIASAPWLNAEGNRLGTIRLGLDASEALAARRSLAQSLLTSGGIIAVVSLLVGVVLSQRALAPLSSLARQARGVDPGAPRMAQYHGPHDEVADVAEALNKALAGIRARQQAERASLAEVAHELAAPLTLVRGHLEALNARLGNDEHLKAARDAAAELLYTSQDLLTLARGELERPLELCVCDLNTVIERVHRDYPGIQVNTPQTQTELAGNPQRLTQLVRNLVRNAVQASGHEMGVRLTLERDQEQLRLEVSDDGPGIPEAELAHIFERFYTKRGGVGVGLSVAKHIAEQHGGTITATSCPQGARFTVRLPSLEAKLEPTPLET